MVPKLKDIFLGLLVCALVLPAVAMARCDVQEVIEMVEDDMSSSMIRNACNEDIDVPNCELSKVIRLARSGDSESDIYEQCEEVAVTPPAPIPDDGKGSGNDDPYGYDDGGNTYNPGLPAGTYVRPCGCWGFVQFGTRDVVPECASGYGEAVGCPYYCVGGGYQWAIMCL